jgi:hypothetical protein
MKRIIENKLKNYGQNEATNIEIQHKSEAN